MRGSLRWVAPALVLALAAGLRLWALHRPDLLVFDELYYVRDAVSQLAHGYPTVWPDDDPAFGGERAELFTGTASNAVHPPLGKWLIGLGVLLFGADSGWGWRSAVAVAGVLTVAVTMRLGWRISRSTTVACLAGLLLAVDGVHVALTRVALLDGFLTLFVALGALLVWRDHEQVMTGAVVGRLWRRPWLLLAGAVFGAAASIKWSGLFALAGFLLFTVVRDWVVLGREPGSHRTGFTLARALAAGLIALPAAAVVYIAGWAGWIVADDGYGRASGEPWWVSLWRYHASMLDWHGSLTAPHPYQSHPLTWPLALQPTAMYHHRWGPAEGCPWDECVSGISSLPNPLVTWAGVLALGVLLWLVVRAVVRRRTSAMPPTAAIAAGFVLTGYLSGWLPWILIPSRSAVFQFYGAVLTPFSALALALVLGALCRRRPPGADAGAGTAQWADDPLPWALDPSPAALKGRRIAVGVFVFAAVALGLWFFPVWSGAPVAEWFWSLHLWLPDWV